MESPSTEQKLPSDALQMTKEEMNSSPFNQLPNELKTSRNVLQTSKEEMNSSPFNQLPIELKVKIVSFLPLVEICRLAVVNKTFSDISNMKSVWRSKPFKIYFNIRPHIYKRLNKHYNLHNKLKKVSSLNYLKMGHNEVTNEDEYLVINTFSKLIPSLEGLKTLVMDFENWLFKERLRVVLPDSLKHLKFNFSIREEITIKNFIDFSNVSKLEDIDMRFCCDRINLLSILHPLLRDCKANKSLILYCNESISVENLETISEITNLKKLTISCYKNLDLYFEGIIPQDILSQENLNFNTKNCIESLYLGLGIFMYGNSPHKIFAKIKKMMPNLKDVYFESYNKIDLVKLLSLIEDFESLVEIEFWSQLPITSYSDDELHQFFFKLHLLFERREIKIILSSGPNEEPTYSEIDLKSFSQKFFKEFDQKMSTEDNKKLSSSERDVMLRTELVAKLIKEQL